MDPVKVGDGDDGVGLTGIISQMGEVGRYGEQFKWRYDRVGFEVLSVPGPGLAGVRVDGSFVGGICIFGS